MLRKESVIQNVQEKPKYKQFICAECGTPGRLVCSACNSVFYCTPEHQKSNWKQHKPFCNQTGRNYSASQKKQLLIQRHLKLRQQAIKYLVDYNFHKSLGLMKQAQLVAKTLFIKEERAEFFCQMAADRFFQVNILFQTKSKAQSKNLFSEFLNNFSSILNFKRDLLLQGLPKNEIMQDASQLSNFRYVSSVISTIAQLCHKLQMQETEQYYLRLMLVIKLCFGKQSLQYSNCEFMLSAFYIKQKQLPKAKAYLKECLATRRTQLKAHQENVYVMHCYLNLGLIQFAQRSGKCIQLFEKYADLNESLNLGITPLLAQVYEYLGFQYLADDEFQPSLEFFQMSYEIRAKLTPRELHKSEECIKKFYRTLWRYIEDNQRDDNKLLNLVDIQNKLEGNLLYKKFMDAERELVLNQQQNDSIHESEQSQPSGQGDRECDLIISQAFYVRLNAREREQICLLQRKLDVQTNKDNRIYEIQNYMRKIENNHELFNLLRFSNQKLFNELRI